MRRAIFVGQAMPRFKKDLHDWPTLNTWLFSIGITEAEIRHNFFYSALVDYFPGAKAGSHLVPTITEIEIERPRLQKTIQDFRPELVVPIGKLSISYCLNQPLIVLAETIGNKYQADPYQALGYVLPILPLPHPSGASTWPHKPENKKLLQKSLGLLKELLDTGE